MTSIDIFDEPFRNMLQSAVGSSGNIGDIYNRHLKYVLPRENGLNTINNGNSGIIYSYTFGTIQTQGPEPSAGGTIETIRDCGYLYYSVSPSLGFSHIDCKYATWSGMDVDIYRGVSADLFHGNVEVQFTVLKTQNFFLHWQMEWSTYWRAVLNILKDEKFER